VLGSTSMWSIWSSYQKLLLLSKISRNKKSQRRKDVPYRRVVDSAHFSSHEEKKLSIKASEQETFAYVRFVFSTICKKNSSMHSEIINQVKCMRELTYLRRDQPATIFFFFFITTSCGQEAYPSMEHHV
jgi:hypothetical protein